MTKSSFRSLSYSHLILFALTGFIFFSLTCYWYQKISFYNPRLWHYCDIWISSYTCHGSLYFTLLAMISQPVWFLWWFWMCVEDTNCLTVWSTAKTRSSSYKPCGSYILTSPHSMNHWLEKQQLSFATAGVWEGSILRGRRRGSSGASSAHYLIHGAGEPVDVTEFLKTAGAFHTGLLWHLFYLVILLFWSYLLGQNV